MWYYCISEYIALAFYRICSILQILLKRLLFLTVKCFRWTWITCSCPQHNLQSQVPKNAVRAKGCRLTSEIIFQNGWSFKMEYFHSFFNTSFRFLYLRNIWSWMAQLQFLCLQHWTTYNSSHALGPMNDISTLSLSKSYPQTLILKCPLFSS